MLCCLHGEGRATQPGGSGEGTGAGWGSTRFTDTVQVGSSVTTESRLGSSRRGTGTPPMYEWDSQYGLLDDDSKHGKEVYFIKPWEGTVFILLDSF